MNSKTKLIPIFLLFSILIPISFSISLEDLVASYDDSYNNDIVNITSITHKGLDIDGGLNDILMVNITMKNTEGYFSIIGDLYKDNIFIQTFEKRMQLQSGVNQILLNFSPELITNGRYNLSLSISKDFLIMYRNKSAYSLDYDNSDFKKPEIDIYSVIGGFYQTDSDERYESLVIVMDINSTISGNFNITVYVRDIDTVSATQEFYLDVGETNVFIMINSSDIRKKRISNGKLYRIIVKNGLEYRFYPDKEWYFKNTWFDPESSIFSDEYNETASDNLQITVGLDINKEGDYRIEGELYDMYNNFISAINQTFTVSPGLTSVNLTINGSVIYRSNFNGPYVIKYLKLIREGILDNVADPYTTKPYNYDQFRKPNMPDLVITSVTVNDNKVSSRIENTGSSYAISTFVTFFDQEFIIIEKTLITLLAPGDSIDINFTRNMSNITTLYTVVDYDNIIEEQNDTNNMFTSLLGRLAPFLIYPKQDINVTQYEFFNFTSGVKCIKGDCGDVTVTLDPPAESEYLTGAVPTSTETNWCYLFGHGGYGPYKGISYKNMDIFELLAGDQVCFDLGNENDVNISLNISLCSGNCENGYTQIVNNKKAAIPKGDNICGSWELCFDIDNPYSFPGGNLDVRIKSTGAFADDTTCNPVLCYTEYDDPANKFVEIWWEGGSDQYHIPGVKFFKNLDKHIIPEQSGYPFYTINNNPAECKNLKKDDNCTTIWFINTTGKINTVHEFFTIYESEEHTNETPSIFIRIKEQIFEYNITLFSGWNLISIPLDKSINSILGQIISIFSDREYYLNSTHNNFDELNSSKGYWVNSIPQTIPIKGTKPNTTNIHLVKGWNLIGYPSLEPALINETLEKLNFSTVMYYNDSRWYSYNKDRPDFLNTIKYLKPGQGYWVNSGNDSVLIIKNFI
ncbi:MAG: CARDB domain-containing protein [Nanoarchaeota archaeon]